MQLPLLSYPTATPSDIVSMGRAAVRGDILKFPVGQFYFYAASTPGHLYQCATFYFTSTAGTLYLNLPPTIALWLCKKPSLCKWIFRPLSLSFSLFAADKSCAQSVDINFVSLLLAKIAYRQCTGAMRYYYPIFFVNGRGSGEAGVGKEQSVGLPKVAVQLPK